MNITVGTESALVATPQQISTTSNGANASVTISGGTPPYSTQPFNSSIASVTMSGNTLMVVGRAVGSAPVIVQDSYSPAKTIPIQITVGIIPTISGTSSSENVSIQAGSTTTINIATSDPTIIPTITTQPNSATATAQIDPSNSTLAITGVAAGNALVVVAIPGSGGAAATTVTVSITVTPIAGSNTTF
jgi:hypothetical protein